MQQGFACFGEIIHDEVDIKENSVQQNSGKQILNSLPKDESKYFLY